MTPDCIVYGPLIAAAVGFLRRWPFVRNNTKIIAAVIATVAAGAKAYFVGGQAASYTAIAACVATYFSGAVATAEVVKTARGE